MEFLLDWLLGAGIILVGLGLLLGGARWPASLPGIPAILICAAGLAAAIRRQAVRWMRGRAMSQPTSSEAVERWSPQLLGSYTPYVIEAAQQLGASGDSAAAPILIYALEECVQNQQPGWRDVAEAIAHGLAELGDSRALPVLRKLENVRGIGFIPAIRGAIAAIEPPNSLLRAGHEMELSSLLRPQEQASSTDAANLLRTSAREEPLLALPVQEA